jgi:ADP-ribose pyrophosphatase YjhB (NUDIX family)
MIHKNSWIHLRLTLFPQRPSGSKKVSDKHIWPRVGCGAAIVSDGKLLLVKRRRSPEAGHWGLPGGKVDGFEALSDAVAREIDEELGLAITGERLLCLVDQIDRSLSFHWVAPVYLVTSFNGSPAIKEPEAPITFATQQVVAMLKGDR